jgi:hypothetical protein
MALVVPPLRFTAHAINRDGHRVPYTVQFTHGEALGRLSLRIEHAVDGVIHEEAVRDVVAVAFYPVALRSANSAFADEYVMSVWQRNAGVADPQIVHNLNLYSTSRANARGDQLSPVRPGFMRPSTLRFGEAQIRPAVNEESWARFDWISFRLPGYVLAGHAGAPAPAPALVFEDDPDDAATDISALLESATLTDDEKVDITEKWECGICLLGLEGGRHLVSAHAVAADRGGRHRLHVFHSQCLRNWRSTDNGCAQLCPKCKLPLRPRPLPAAWSATTRLSAPMALTLPSMRNPYVCSVLKAGLSK